MRPVAICALALAVGLGGCSARQLAVDAIGDALAQNGAAFAADDDPELVRAAAPFSLKLIESLIEQSPRHRGLLLAGARGFTQYAYAFVQQDAEQAEDSSVEEARRLEERARRLYRRARDYGVRGLASGRPGFVGALHDEPRRALAGVPQSEVPLLYWTAAAWGSLIAASKDSPELIAELPIVEALIERALALDESFDGGALHTFLIALRPGRARQHFARALELSQGRSAAPFVALAEGACVAEQQRAEFEVLLQRALDIDADREPANRLANLVAQRRARWLLSRTERLFTS